MQGRLGQLEGLARLLFARSEHLRRAAATARHVAVHCAAWAASLQRRRAVACGSYADGGRWINQRGCDAGDVRQGTCCRAAAALKVHALPSSWEAA